jgi:hypothetical protein
LNSSEAKCKGDYCVSEITSNSHEFARIESLIFSGQNLGDNLQNRALNHVKVGTNLFIIKSQEITIDGNPGWQIEFFHNPLECNADPHASLTAGYDICIYYQKEGTPVEYVMVTIILTPSKEYIIEYSQEDLIYSKNTQLLKYIINSIQIL